MNREETAALVLLVLSAQNRNVPSAPMVEAWHLILGDLDYGNARLAIIELLKSQPFMPTPADIRERVKIIVAERERRRGQIKSIADRSQEQPHARRTGAAMVRYVLQRLRDEGQDPKRGKFLGVERATQIAEQACNEWLEQTR